MCLPYLLIHPPSNTPDVPQNAPIRFCLGVILSVFFGFKFLPNKEENNNFPPEEGGILEEFLPLDLEYISPVQIQL